MYSSAKIVVAGSRMYFWNFTLTLCAIKSLFPGLSTIFMIFSAAHNIL